MRDFMINSMKCKSFKKTGILVVGILSWSLVFQQETARANDWLWKFNVKVQLMNIPKDLKSIRVDVVLFDKQMKMIAAGRSFAAMKPDGSFNDIVAVTVYPKDVLVGKIPGEATQYKAHFSFSPSSPGNGPYYPPNTDAIPITKAKPNTPFVPVVFGSLPIPKPFKPVILDLPKK